MFVAWKAIQSEARETRDEVSGVEECGGICLEDSTDFLFVKTLNFGMSIYNNTNAH